MLGLNRQVKLLGLVKKMAALGRVALGRVALGLEGIEGLALRRCLGKGK